MFTNTTTIGDIVNTNDDTPYIDTISARDLVHLMHSAGLIELPYLEGDVIEITSCPVDPAYTLRDDLPCARPDLSLRSETCVTDYDVPPHPHYDEIVLHPYSRMTMRIAITLGDD